MKRAGVLGGAAMLFGVAAMVMGSAGLAGATGLPTQGAPPGNNGTIKIDETPLVEGGGPDNANHPHVMCQFALSFFGYDVGLQTADVSFAAQPPSGSGTPVSPILGPGVVQFQGLGPGNSLDASIYYELDVTGLTAQKNQGYHIKVTVDVSGSQGADEKYKVFWYEPCSTPTIPPTTASPTTPATTAPPTTPATTAPPTTQGGSGAQISTTTSLAPVVGSGNQVGGITPSGGAAPLVASGGNAAAPLAASGVAAQAGPVPAGAGTDVGYFKPDNWLGGSQTSWILMIVAGVLLVGTGMGQRLRLRRG